MYKITCKEPFTHFSTKFTKEICYSVLSKAILLHLGHSYDGRTGVKLKRSAVFMCITWDLLAEADIEKMPPGLLEVLHLGCDRDIGVRLNFLDGSSVAEVSDRCAVALRQVQGDGVIALLTGQGLPEAPRGRRQVQGAVLRDAQVPGEAVEGHRQAGVQLGHRK